MRINQYFDKIYLLNLHRRSDRLIKSLEKINHFELNVEVFGGCDGSVMNYIFNKLQHPFFTNPSYLGCVVSHLSIYQDALSKGYEKILILEDDNLINQNLHNFFDNLEIPDWSDLFYLGYIPLNDDRSMWTYVLTMRSEQMLTNNIFKCTNLWGLYAYGITNQLMRECVEVYNNELPMELDRYFVSNVQPRGNSIAIGPQLFCCDSDVYSDNLGYSPDVSLTVKSIDSRYAKIEDYI